MRPHLWPLAALWLLALIAYSDSFRAGLAMDNAGIILGDTRIREATSHNLDLIFTQEYWYNISTTGLYRPLTTLSYLFNYAVLGNGANPAGYHWVNLLLHGVNMTLVYCLGLLVFKDRIRCLLLAAVWGVHPVLTESVTNIVGRADLLAAFGVLAALLCYARAMSASGRARAVWLTGAACATAIGMFSKESAIVVIAVVVLYDIAFGTAPRRARLAGYTAVAAPVLLFLSIRSAVLSKLYVGRVPFLDNPLLGADFVSWQLTAVKVIGKYLAMLVWPAALSADYSYNAIPLVAWPLHSWDDWKAVLAIAVVLAAAALAVVSYRRRPALFFWIAFLFATLLPTSNILLRIGTIMAERFLYLPAIGFAGLVVMAASLRPRPGREVVALIVVLFTMRTWARNLDWYDDFTLLGSAESVVPESAKVHTVLSERWLARPADLDRAAAESDQALVILAPLPDALNSARAYAVAGQCYLAKGDAARAAATLERAVRIDRADAETIRQLNLAQGKRITATGWYPVYLTLGRAWLRLSEPLKAIDALTYGAMLRQAPEFFEELSAAHQALGDTHNAEVALVEGLALNNGNREIASRLGALYNQAEPGSCAIERGMLNFNCPLVRGELCEAARNVVALHRAAGRYAAADAAAAGAVRDLGCPAALFQ